LRATPAAESEGFKGEAQIADGGGTWNRWVAPRDVHPVYPRKFRPLPRDSQADQGAASRTPGAPSACGFHTSMLGRTLMACSPASRLSARPARESMTEGSGGLCLPASPSSELFCQRFWAWCAADTPRSCSLPPIGPSLVRQFDEPARPKDYSLSFNFQRVPASQIGPIDAHIWPCLNPRGLYNRSLQLRIANTTIMVIEFQ
jgi:hypothetical protein